MALVNKLAVFVIPKALDRLIYTQACGIIALTIAI